ncbi:MAG: beta-lactamase family protein, partial [bacterium]|nr:beta-lactamase family protein [bacterium]
MFTRTTKHVILSTFILASILLGMAAWGQAAARAATVSRSEPPLRLAEPADAVIADLESYIPGYMSEQNIPGASIALIREGQIVWTEGFGVVNAITRQPVTSETLFEVASNSKVVTAYVALRLVDQGKLSLDEPLNAYLPEPWLPPEYRDVITLRHV